MDDAGRQSFDSVFQIAIHQGFSCSVLWKGGIVGARGRPANRKAKKAARESTRIDANRRELQANEGLE
jgi:hypothetical protein